MPIVMSKMCLMNIIIKKGIAIMDKIINITQKPAAYAVISGNEDNRKLHGVVYFYKTPFGGTLVEAEIDGLPME